LRRAENEKIREKTKITKKLITKLLPNPDQPHQLAFAPGCHAFCKKDCKKSVPALRLHKKALRGKP